MLVSRDWPHPKQLGQSELPGIGSLQCSKILGHEACRFETISQPSLRLFLAVRRHLRGLPVGPRHPLPLLHQLSRKLAQFSGELLTTPIPTAPQMAAPGIHILCDHREVSSPSTNTAL
jgi:hypothetical protein